MIMAVAVAVIIIGAVFAPVVPSRHHSFCRPAHIVGLPVLTHAKIVVMEPEKANITVSSPLNTWSLVADGGYVIVVGKNSSLEFAGTMPEKLRGARQGDVVSLWLGKSLPITFMRERASLWSFLMERCPKPYR